MKRIYEVLNFQKKFFFECFIFDFQITTEKYDIHYCERNFQSCILIDLFRLNRLLESVETYVFATTSLSMTKRK
jgi:hypothetical protein